MKLSNAEKLILMMLCDVHEHMNINGDSGIDPTFVKEAILTDNAWGIEWKYSLLFADSNEPTPPLVTEVVNYMDMWRFIESSFKNLTDAERAQLEAAAGVFGKDPKFRGFDGNNEGEYMSVASFLIEHLGRFSEFAERDLNTHYPAVANYRRMYSQFEPMRRRIGHLGLGRLSVEELSQLLRR